MAAYEHFHGLVPEMLEYLPVNSLLELTQSWN